MNKQQNDQKISITDIWVDRAAYQPGEAATLLLLVHNREEYPVTTLLHVTLSWLDQEISVYDQRLEIQPGQQQVSLPLELPVESFRGYGVDVTLYDEDASPYAWRSTALDVLENWTQAPRYGFLSDFAPDDHGTEAACASLARYHVESGAILRLDVAALYLDATGGGI